MRVRQLNAVHDRDLEDLLASLKIQRKLEAGEIKCSSCDKVVTLDSLGGLFFSNGQVHAICDDLGCIDTYRGRGVEE